MFPPSDAIVAILIFVVGLIFGIGITYQRIGDLERRLKALEDWIKIPPGESSAVLVLRNELENLKGKLSAIENELSKLRDSTEEHYRTLENLVTQIVKNSERIVNR
jgi:hypothetical protein